MILWNFKTGETLCRLLNYIGNLLALTPGGEFLLSVFDDCDENKKLKLWKLPNADLVEEFHFDQYVQVIACDSNGMVCVGLEGGRVCFLRFNDLSSISG